MLACIRALALDRLCIFAWVTYGMVPGGSGKYRRLNWPLRSRDLDLQARALYPESDDDPGVRRNSLLQGRARNATGADTACAI